MNKDALFLALTEGRIAGAALDCFETEPLREPSRFGQLDTVVLAPHSMSWTAEMFRDIGRSACQSMLDISLGRRPNGVLNPELLERPALLQKWARVIGLSDPGLPKL